MKKVVQFLVVMLGVLMLPATTHAQNIDGDVNNDGEVNIADVNSVIDIVLGAGSGTSADVNHDHEINIADINAVIDIILSGGGQAVPEYVDLGLPSGTLWATRNVGASNPEDYGDYFAWGETQPKESYSWKTYKWCDGDEWSINKYDPTAFWDHDELELEPADDAATVNWGQSWHIPSQGQFEELCNSCTWQFTQRNGVDGSLATGPNGNTLFFPAAGYRSNSSLSRAGTSGFYWSSTVDYSQVQYALYMNCFSNEAHCITGYYGRSPGYTIRAVRVAPADEQPLRVKQHHLDLGEVPTGVTRTDELTLINNNDADVTLTITTDGPFSLKQGESSASSMTVTVVGNSIMPVTVLFTAGTPGDFNGNVTVQGQALYGGQSVIPVHAHAVANDYEEHEYVDLGLPSGTLWATCNIGASKPEERGDYFAWGETQPKDYYALSSYKWYASDANHSGFIKYCVDSLSYNGFIDNKMELDLADDAAYVNWGPAWRTPTIDQLEELYDNCSKSWTQLNGVNGYLFKGPNGKTLFMPTTGIKAGASRFYGGWDGIYWSSTINYYEPDRAYMMTFYSEDCYSFWDKRCYGFTVRPLRAR